jgi:serine/threonine protein kinase
VRKKVEIASNYFGDFLKRRIEQEKLTPTGEGDAMSEPTLCPECGSDLPSGALGGLCPRCLLAAGFDSAAEQPPTGSGEAPTTPHGAGFVPPNAAWLAKHFPQLDVVELLGCGGMGAVYKARQPRLDRLVALKIIRPESASSPAFAERFNREARLLARLSHPHIVAVYDFGEVNVTDPASGNEPRTLYYFLMEYVEGVNLRQLLQSGELTPPQALAIVPQICEALQFAHDEGVVHRDIKPENILLDKRGRVKIADFGLAKLATGSAVDFTLTATHQVMGTPRYMAPEQMEGSHAVDHRADIYSLGVVFYEMLTVEIPAGHFEPPSKKVEIDVRLDEVVLRAMAREPQRRYQHASDIKSDVDSITAKTGAIERASASTGRPFWQPTWLLYSAYSAIFVVMLYTLFTAIYGPSFSLSLRIILPTCIAIVTNTLLAAWVTRRPFDNQKSWTARHNLVNLVLAILMLMLPNMVLSPVDLKDWLPAHLVSYTADEEKWLRIVSLGLFLWSCYFVFSHVSFALGRTIRHGTGQHVAAKNASLSAGEPLPRNRQTSNVEADVMPVRSRRDETARSAEPLSDAAAENFLLMNPRLPVTAQWITVYCIAFRPVLWLLLMMFAVLSFESSLVGDYAEAAIDHAVDIFGGLFHLVFVVIVVVGGFKLRARRRDAANWINIGLGLGFAVGLLIFILQSTFTPHRIELLREVARTNPEQLLAEDFTQKEIDAILTDKEYPILVPDVISVFFAAVWLVLDIVVFVWLWRNSRYLPYSEANVRAAPPLPSEVIDSSQLATGQSALRAVAGIWFCSAGLALLAGGLAAGDLRTDHFWGWLSSAFMCCVAGLAFLGAFWQSGHVSVWFGSSTRTSLDRWMFVLQVLGVILLVLPPLLMLLQLWGSQSTPRIRALLLAIWVLGALINLEWVLYHLLRMRFRQLAMSSEKPRGTSGRAWDE